MVCVKMVNNLAYYTEKRCKNKEVIKLLSKLYIYSFIYIYIYSTPLNLVYSIDVLTITFIPAMMKMESFFYVENSGLSFVAGDIHML